MSEYFLERKGYCPACRSNVVFKSQYDWLRDHYFCSNCHSIPRVRALVHILDIIKPNWMDLSIHESSPSGKYIQQLAQNYSYSHFFHDKELGSYVDGIRNENLEALTFPDNSFDLFIHMDVMEHVFNPDQVIQESIRVIKPDGVIVFTAPKWKDLDKTCQRAKFVDGKTIFLEEPMYHSNPIGEGSLVTYDYGSDFPALLQSWCGNLAVSTDLYVQSVELGIEGEFLNIFVVKPVK